MSSTKRIFTCLLSVMFLLMMAPAIAFAEGASDGRIIVYAQVPDDWSNPCLWAWSDDGTNAFDAWPGEAMEADANNEGWYYCWIPESATNIIINANDSTVQTTDQKIEAQNTWVTVTDAENVAVSYEQQTSGDIPEYVETFKIHAQVPESWQDVRLWAWLDPDGTNASAAWPGKAMTAGEDGWYTATAPVWVNRIIVNGNGGEVQTEDLSIDPAEIWVTVSEDGTAEFTYNDPNAPVAEDITVRVKAPADWSEPNLWAWSAPDGTNAFSAWPGEPLEDTGDGTQSTDSGDDTQSGGDSSSSATSSLPEGAPSGELKIGDEGDDVLRLQYRLQELGYLFVPPTGLFAEGTEQCVKDFQLLNGMVVTGVADEATIALLFSDEAVPRNAS